MNTKLIRKPIQEKVKTLPHFQVPILGTPTNSPTSYLVFKHGTPKPYVETATGLNSFKASVELIGTMEIGITNKIPKHSARFLIQTAAMLFKLDSKFIMTQKQGGRNESF